MSFLRRLLALSCGRLKFQSLGRMGRRHVSETANRASYRVLGVLVERRDDVGEVSLLFLHLSVGEWHLVWDTLPEGKEMLLRMKA